MSDIMTFCPEKRPAQDKYGLPSNSSYFIMSEIPEVTSAMLTDSKLMAMLSKYPDAIDSIHFSDQYTVSKKNSKTIVKMFAKKFVKKFVKKCAKNSSKKPC